MRALLYTQYLANIVFQVFIVCMVFSQPRWNKWRKWGLVTFFAAGAGSSITLAQDVFTKTVLTVPLTSGPIFYLGLVRMAALASIAWGLWRARARHEEDVV